MGNFVISVPRYGTGTKQDRIRMIGAFLRKYMVRDSSGTGTYVVKTVESASKMIIPDPD
jgi:hypothetical protein